MLGEKCGASVHRVGFSAGLTLHGVVIVSCHPGKGRIIGL